LKRRIRMKKHRLIIIILLLPAAILIIGLMFGKNGVEERGIRNRLYKMDIKNGK
jgi:Na+-transporting methylmalonyl-CoA/oxaloacetate decarboxylase beta subunit